MADVIASSYHGQKGEKNRASKALLGDATFSTRGYGTFDVWLGVGSYGQDLDGGIRRRSNIAAELLRGEGRNATCLTARARRPRNSSLVRSGWARMRPNMSNWEIPPHSRGGGCWGFIPFRRAGSERSQYAAHAGHVRQAREQPDKLMGVGIWEEPYSRAKICIRTPGRDSWRNAEDVRNSTTGVWMWGGLRWATKTM